ncbi:MAG: hypothetical protein HW413_2271 [Thermoleophilia bacterium]|nr:hypothetical protein [Thermoleophilia bacterium]
MSDTGSDVITAIGGPAATVGLVAGGLVAWLADFDPANFVPATVVGAIVGGLIGFIRRDREESRQRAEARRQAEATQASIQGMSESERQQAIEASPFLRNAIPEMEKGIREALARNRDPDPEK